MGVQLKIFTCSYPVVRAPFVKETVLSPSHGLGNLVKNQFAVSVLVYF